MKKFRIKYLFWVILMCLQYSLVQAQYITLEGRQFKLSNQDFYPMVCNYTLQITFNNLNPGLNDYYLSPTNSYGPGVTCVGCCPLPNSEYECSNSAEGYTQIVTDFAKIADMGFNTVRILGLSPYKSDTDLIGVIGFIDTAYQNIHPNYNGVKSEIQYNPPYDTNPQVNTILLPMIDLIMQAANSTGLKVILVAGAGGIDHCDTDASDYADYLLVLADHLKNNTALFAYDLVNEPYGPWENIPSKKKVCEYTSMWYDAINAEDANHLVTLGGHTVWAYDPQVMKLDFLSPHLYPYYTDYDNYNQTSGMDRIKGEIIWAHNNSPVPWMIGETGHNAIDDYYVWDNNLWVPSTLLLPVSDGTLSDQANYAANTLAHVRNCGGSGYSWWNYQENWWGPKQDGFGLLRHGSLDTLDKPVVSVFENYPSPPPAPQTCDFPTNYYDPYNYDDYNPNLPNYLQGGVSEEGTSKNIEDAVVKMVLTVLLPNDSIQHTFVNYSYTQAGGGYAINKTYPNSISSRIFTMEFAAAGGETFWERFYYPNQPTNFYNCTLKVRPFLYDGLFNNVTITSYTSRNLKARNTLFISNVLIEDHAISEIKAANGIDIYGEFTAELTSDVYIYCTETYPDCDDFDFSKELKSATATTNDSQEPDLPVEKTIDLNFIPEKDYTYLEVYPNPGNGIFNVNLQTNHSEFETMQIFVYNITGTCVYSSEISANNSSIDLSSFSKGMYYLHCHNTRFSFNEKIVIQ